MQETTRKLFENVYLHHIETDRFKNSVFSIRFYFRQRRGLSAADSVLPRILLQGSEQYQSQRELLLRAEELYGTKLTSSSERLGKMRLITFSAYMIDGAYLPQESRMPGDAISLLLNAVYRPLTDPETGFFREDLLRHEVRGHLERIASIKNHRTAHAVMKCTEFMQSPRYYDVPAYGTEEEALALDSRKLYGEYRYMIRNAEVHLSYSGTRPLSEIAELVRAELASHLPRNADVLLGKLYFGRKRARGIRRASLSADGSQSVLVLGYRTGMLQSDPDAWKYAMLTEILADSPIAKLFMGVREKEGLCYSINARANLMNGILTVSAGIDPARAAEAERAIRREIRRTAAGIISEEEMTAAKESLVSAYFGILDSAANYELYRATAEIRRITLSLEERIARIRAIGADEVAALAAKLSLDTVFLLSAEKEAGNHA